MAVVSNITYLRRCGRLAGKLEVLFLTYLHRDALHKAARARPAPYGFSSVSILLLHLEFASASP